MFRTHLRLHHSLISLLFLLLLNLTGPAVRFAFCAQESPSSHPSHELYLSTLLSLDDSVRASFSTLSSASSADSAVSSVLSLVDSYASIRRYQRALGLLSVSRPPVVSNLVYAWRLAPLEAQMLLCYDDVDGALVVLHQARDLLLKFLGALKKEDLPSYFDVWTDVFGMTSKLIVWYHNNSNFNAVSALSLWMQTNGMYMGQYQLPALYVRELPILGPWPSWSDFSFLDLKSSKTLLRSYRRDLSQELERAKSAPPDARAPALRDETGCLVQRALPEDVDSYWRHVERRGKDCRAVVEGGGGGGGGGGDGEEGECDDGDDGGERRGRSSGPNSSGQYCARGVGAVGSVLCSLVRDFEKSYTLVHRISLNTVSGLTSIRPHFGESNVYLTMIMGLDEGGGGRGEGDGKARREECLRVKVFSIEKTMGRAASAAAAAAAAAAGEKEQETEQEKSDSDSESESDDIFLIDTSFLTALRNDCDTPFSFLKIDFVHPQFVGEL